MDEVVDETHQSTKIKLQVVPKSAASYSQANLSSSLCVCDNDRCSDEQRGACEKWIPVDHVSRLEATHSIVGPNFAVDLAVQRECQAEESSENGLQRYPA